ncbi:MAG TPA: hypothetical protein VHQ65_02565 [Thermoanaerobaculia bacterium]|nr:hypothetical protein [Thermoanaerobaculia bacterium]
MSTRTITADLPEDLLRDAMEMTGKDITGTLVALEQVRRRRAFDRAMALQGKVRLDIDLDVLRERDGG